MWGVDLAYQFPLCGMVGEWRCVAKGRGAVNRGNYTECG